MKINNRTSVIWKLNKDELSRVVAKHKHWSDILKEMGISLSGTVYRTLRQRLDDDKISYTHIDNKNYDKARGKKIPLSSVLTENSTYSRHLLKKRLLLNGMLEYRCYKCGNIGEWQGDKLSLQIDHKNGVRDDNRLENLHILCPNCHSQTRDYSGKHKKNKVRLTVSKNILEELLKDNNMQETAGILKTTLSVLRNTIKDFGIIYHRKQKYIRKFEATKEELCSLVKQMPLTQVAKIYGVTDNSVRKRCKGLGIDTKIYGRGYWQKKYTKVKNIEV